MREVDALRPARVVSVGRNEVWIAFEDSDELQLASRRKTLERQTLVPGDLVLARRLDDDRVQIERREPRSFTLERRTGSGRDKTMAANVDGIAIVAALIDPPFHAAMVDELLAFAGIHELTARLVLTKLDLAEPEAAAGLTATYQLLGYTVLAINPKTQSGIAAVERELAGRRTLLIGQSGVGKSSLFRGLGGSGPIGDVSKIGRGRQTTSAGRLHNFAEGFLIDSPGVSDFELHGFDIPTVAAAFVEFAPLLGTCRFSDCTHRSEPDCAIRAAVAGGTIAASRYASFREIIAREDRR
jgi:ribosome biogenesis GTPase / thiamine phosphate phosphatase